MSSEIAAIDEVGKEIIANIVLKGDLSGLAPEQKTIYYNMFCESLGLNPVTRPFQIINLSGKEILYATKDATEQLRQLKGVSVVDMQKEIINNIYTVTVKAQDKEGRYDIATGAVNIKNFAGDALANAIMKAETKAKRRVTLSICGLGMLDESEIETIPGARIEPEIKSIENQTVPEEKPRGNFENIMKAINAASTIEKLDFITAGSRKRTWTNHEIQLIDEEILKIKSFIKAEANGK